MKAKTTVLIISLSALWSFGTLFAQTPVHPVQPIDQLPQQEQVREPVQVQTQETGPAGETTVRTPGHVPIQPTPVPQPTPTPVVQTPIPEPVHEEPVVEVTRSPEPVSRYHDPEKDSYEARMSRRIEDLAREIARLKDQTTQLPKRKEKLAQDSLRTAAGNRSVAKTKLRQLSNAGPNDWEALKRGVEMAMQELENSVDRTKGFLTASES